MWDSRFFWVADTSFELLILVNKVMYAVARTSHATVDGQKICNPANKRDTKLLQDFVYQLYVQTTWETRFLFCLSLSKGVWWCAASQWGSHTLTSPACQIIEMYSPLRRQQVLWKSVRFFSIEKILLLFVFFLGNLLAANSTPLAHFLNSHSFWRGHPIWLQLHHHHDELANPDAVPCSNSRRSYSEASAMNV